MSSYLVLFFLAASGLSCSMRDLRCGVWALHVVRGLLSSCGMWVFSSLVVVHRLQGVWAL